MEFNIKRIGYAIRKDITLLKTTGFTALAVASGILFIGLFLMTRGDDYLSADEFMGLFGLCFVVLGVFFSFAILRESHNVKSSHLYFALPIAPLERLTAVWLTTTLIHTLVFTVMALLVGQLAIVAGGVIFGSGFHWVSLFSEGYVKLIKGYFIIQPVFLCGAMAFSKNGIGKTLLTLVLVFIGMLFYGLLLFSILNHGVGVYPGDLIADQAFDKASKDFSGVGTWFFTLIFGPLMLWAAYFKLVEKEV
ncbi:hypothetical protein [Ulvibacterium sp.]|uniref:hypothetical protein n=1 Tax=Ulvibacterium sp. TaxID=2665914 RepID=UPI003BAD8A54